MVARQTTHPDFIERDCPESFETWVTLIYVPFVFKLKGWPASSENRVCGKQAFQRYLDAENMILRAADRGDEVSKIRVEWSVDWEEGFKE